MAEEKSYDKKVLLAFTQPDKSGSKSADEIRCLLSGDNANSTAGKIIYVDKEQDFNQDGSLKNAGDPKWAPIKSLTLKSQLVLSGHCAEGSDHLSSDRWAYPLLPFIPKDGPLGFLRAIPSPFRKDFDCKEISNIFGLIPEDSSVRHNLYEKKEIESEEVLDVRVQACYAGSSKSVESASFAAKLASSLAKNIPRSTVAKKKSDIVLVVAPKIVTTTISPSQPENNQLGIRCRITAPKCLVSRGNGIRDGEFYDDRYLTGAAATVSSLLESSRTMCTVGIFVAAVVSIFFWPALIADVAFCASWFVSNFCNDYVVNKYGEKQLSTENQAVFSQTVDSKGELIVLAGDTKKQKNIAKHSSKIELQKVMPRKSREIVSQTLESRKIGSQTFQRPSAGGAAVAMPGKHISISKDTSEQKRIDDSLKDDSILVERHVIRPT